MTCVTSLVFFISLKYTNSSRVEAPDDVDVDGLRNVNVPPGLNVEILDFD